MKILRNRIACLPLAITCLAVSCLHSESDAVDLIANFDGGTSAVPDAFNGTAGDGWEAPWNSVATNATASSVVNMVPSSGGPIPGGGNYLQTAVTTNTEGYDGAGTFSLNRKFGTGIEQANPYRVEFTYRIDEDVDSGASTFTGFQDRYMIAEGQGGMTTLNNLTDAGHGNNNYSWSIWGHGGDTDLQVPFGGEIAPNVVRTWAFYNGNSDDDEFDATSSAMTSTGIPIITGGIYDFTIDVNPGTNQWDATVVQKNAAGATIDSYTQTNMGFRGDDGVKTTLHFFTKRSRLDSVTDPDTRAFSIDGIKVSQETAATLFVDRFTGDIRLNNSGSNALNILGYSITSQLGALNASVANFRSITNNYDQGNPGAIDPDDDWEILSAQVDGNDDLSEFLLDFTGPGNGATLSPGQNVVLSQGDGAWIPSHLEEDLVAEITLNDGSGTIVTIPVVYEDSGNNVTLQRSDLNHNGTIDNLDWDILSGNNLVDFSSSGLSAAQMYQLGDIDFDGDNDVNDYLLFRSDYIAEHGTAGFAALIDNSQVVPEPSSLLLVASACFGLLILFKRDEQREYTMKRLQCPALLNKPLQILTTLVATAVVVSGLNRAEALPVIANFDDGVTTTLVDGYSGVAGDGWQGPWNYAQETANTDLSGTTVLNDGNSPLTGGGNYLKTVAVPDPTDDSSARTGLSRKYTDGLGDGVIITQPYRVEFSYRIDEVVNAPGTSFTNYHDRYEIAASGGTAGNNSNDSWSIFAHGATGAHAHAGAVNQWAFYDGDGNGSITGTDPLKMISTGIPLTTGGTYQFTIDVDPVGETWDGTISDGTNTFTQTGMNFRGNSYRKSIVFSTKKSRDLPNGGDVRAFSVDGFSVTEIATEFVASINTVTGNITLRNDTDAPIDFSNYTIESPLGALNTAGWYSLENRSDDGDSLVVPVDGDDPGSVAGDSSVESWTESGGSNASALGELFLIGSTILPAGQSISLGNAYNTSMTDADISFQFYNAASDSLLPGVVEFVTTSVLEGDYNSDGVVNLADYTVWRDNLGASISLPNETATPGSVTSEDYTAWKSNFGASSAALSFSTSPVPEAQTLSMLLLALVGFGTRSVIRK